ncbi:MAG: hypothetical protein HC915_02320 [Anaerolineae bacterium]|nr:hypothetical protein [Anaerolineae bacterium]
MLHQAPFLVDERYVCVYVPLEPTILQSERALLQWLAERVVAQMETIGASTYRVPPFPEDAVNAEALQNWFAMDFLDVALTAIRRDRYLLLMLDDLHLAYDAMDAGLLAPGFMEWLGQLLAQHERLDILAALDVRYEARSLADAPLSNVLMRLRLDPLAPEEAQQLTTAPVSQRYTYSPAALERILELAGGNPFLLHSLCRLVYRMWEENQSMQQIDMRFLEAIHPAALEEAGEVAEPVWNHATPAERLVLQALLRLQAGTNGHSVSVANLERELAAPPAQLEAAQVRPLLRGLEFASVITLTEDGGYRFVAPLEAEWLSANTQPLAPVRARVGLSPVRWAGLAGILLVILLIAGVLLSGVLEEGGASGVDSDAPPTLTLDPPASPSALPD